MCIETRYWFSFFFSNGKKCIVRPKEISIGIWGKRSWNEHPVHCCLLWIVYRPVVIELSKRGPSLICALLRVLILSVYLYNISGGGIFRKQKFHGNIRKELSLQMLFILTLVLNCCCKPAGYLYRFLRYYQYYWK